MVMTPSMAFNVFSLLVPCVAKKDVDVMPGLMFRLIVSPRLWFAGIVKLRVPSTSGEFSDIEEGVTDSGEKEAPASVIVPIPFDSLVVPVAIGNEGAA